MSDPSGAELYGEVLAPMDEATVDSLTRIMLQLYRRGGGVVAQGGGEGDQGGG